ncbi:cytosolic protein (plasmid) [Chloroflexota bacterium]|nr:cytosolic protein [Chloroflexota bacterium]
MECNKDRNLTHCNCSYTPCSRKGICCECIQYHLRMRELPACAFPNDAEATYDRSFELFAELVQAGKV